MPFMWLKESTAVDKDPLRRSGYRAYNVSVGSEPTATDMIPCGDRIPRHDFPWVRNPRLLTRSPAGIGYRALFPWVRNPRLPTSSPAGIGYRAYNVSVGSEPTPTDMIPCGDRIPRL
jgi:hypothetical protein